VFEYRAVTDVEAVAELAKSAFVVRRPDHPALAEWLARSIEHGRELFGVFDGAKLLSVYMLYDFRMRLRSSVVPMGGIGLLCSRLDARGKGAVRTMLREALGTMRDRGHVVSALDPFDQSFYRKYGWEMFERLQRVEIPPRLLRVPTDEEAEHEAVDLLAADEASRAFYNDFARRYRTLVQRGEREWEERTRILSWSANTAARGVVRVSRGGDVVGLMGYDLVGKAGDWHPTFHVTLFLHEDEPAKRAMLRYLERLSHQVKTIRFDLPVDEDLWPYLSDRPAKREVRDQFMIRIVSMEKFDGLGIDADDLSIAIEVADGQAPWNAGTWRWTIEDGVLHVERSDRADLRCGIGPLSSVLSGFTDFSAMIAAGWAESLPSYAGQDLPKVATFLADYF